MCAYGEPTGLYFATGRGRRPELVPRRRDVCGGLFALSVGFVLFGRAFCATDQASRNSSATGARQSSLVAAYKEIGALLLKIERLITDGHSILPVDDTRSPHGHWWSGKPYLPRPALSGP